THSAIADLLSSVNNFSGLRQATLASDAVRNLGMFEPFGQLAHLPNSTTSPVQPRRPLQVFDARRVPELIDDLLGTQMRPGVADETEEEVLELASLKGGGVSTSQAVAIIVGILLLELSIVMYLSGPAEQRFISDTFGFPANVAGWLMFTFFSFSRRK
ncbi:hypothetical protein, partial [Allokutzneria sp. NRRL B-24872]|uniref:hypothetical protein n=1 Tax=Allokutzneria sp. NRRL B-24872 TaxID=1137961 RepID=UPI00143D8F2A